MKISIIGSGAFGLALATMFNKNENNNIYIWSKFQEEIDNLKNENKFMNVDLSKKNNYTTNMEECLNNSNLIIIAIPVAFINDTTKLIKEYYNNIPILVASKGIEQKTNLFAIDIVKNIINTNDIGVISGGTFAIDMLQNKPMGLTLATTSNILKETINKTLKNENLDIQYTKDIIGTELCGSYKNIIAIASGIITGLEYGDSSKFYIITKAIYELENIIVSLHGDKETILSYAGIDDIYMTCSSTHSRNFTLGTLIGKRKQKEIEDYKQKNTIEGLYTTKSIYELLDDKKINSKFINIMYEILYNNKDVTLLIDYLKRN